MKALSYFPQNLQKQPLYVELSDVIQHALDENEVSVLDIKEKYYGTRNPVTLVNEFGYGYIFDILQNSISEEQAVSALVSLIHFHKGTRRGLEIVLELLRFKYDIVEWWQSTENIKFFGTTNSTGFTTNSTLFTAGIVLNTYNTRLTLFDGIVFESSSLRNYREFSDSYVLPKLMQLLLKAEFSEAANLSVSQSPVVDITKDRTRLETPMSSVFQTNDGGWTTNWLLSNGSPNSAKGITWVPYDWMDPITYLDTTIYPLVSEVSRLFSYSVDSSTAQTADSTAVTVDITKRQEGALIDVLI